MAIKTMKAIDYNLWMSIIDNTMARIAATAPEYNIVNINIDVLPSYPKDLTKMRKHSIIIQKVIGNSDAIGLGNVVGEYYDISTDTISDVLGVEYNMLFQANIHASTNTECSIMTSMFIDEVLRASIIIDDPFQLILKDYITDRNNITDIGIISIEDDIDITNLSSNDNNDYMTAIRFNASVVQLIVPQQEYVDLSKAFKYNPIIKL